MGQVAIYSRVERRRRWSDEERWQILEPGAKVLHGKRPVRVLRQAGR